MDKILIPTYPGAQPIEIMVIGSLPSGAGQSFVRETLERQKYHPEFIDEYNEPSALIAPTNFAKKDPTAIYTFGVDTRSLVFHRHQGHRIITGITGAKGCVLKFSACHPEELISDPEIFLKRLAIVTIAADCIFTLRFNGTVYHQFCPGEDGENGFFAISVHTDESAGLSGDILEKVLANHGTIALLTEPVPAFITQLLETPDANRYARHYELKAFSH